MTPRKTVGVGRWDGAAYSLAVGFPELDRTSYLVTRMSIRMLTVNGAQAVTGSDCYVTAGTLAAGLLMDASGSGDFDVADEHQPFPVAPSEVLTFTWVAPAAPTAPPAAGTLAVAVVVYELEDM